MQILVEVPKVDPAKVHMEALRLSWTQEGGAPRHAFSVGNIRVSGALARFRHPGGEPLAKFLTCSMQVECAVRSRPELPDSEKKTCDLRWCGVYEGQVLRCRSSRIAGKN